MPGVSGMNAAADRARHAGRGAAAGPQHRQAARGGPIYQGHLQTVASNAYEVERAVLDADLVIGAVLVPGAKAPTLISNELVSRMRAGSVLVDIAIDQGGCFEDSRPTTHAEPTFRVHDSVFYCVANMPGAVPQHLDLRADERHVAVRAQSGRSRLASRTHAPIPALALGLNTYDGMITNGPVAQAHGAGAPGSWPTSSADGLHHGGADPHLPRPPDRRARHVSAHSRGIPP